MKDNKVFASNRKARHDFFIEKTYEAGIVLTGTEVKSIRQGKVNLKESYCLIKKGEVFVVGMHISPYFEGNIHNVDPLRDRKLLLNRREILRIENDIKLKGLTLIPLSLYLSGRNIKVEIGIARGKKLYDKRESMKERDVKRALERNKY